MSGSFIGSIFKVATFGESHGEALGAVIDGCPAGVALTVDDIQVDMDRRKPGTSKYVTKRAESDKVRILSGVFDGKTTGTPIAIVIFNENQNSKDYSAIADVYRPGHADMCYDEKYGFRDYRGGGRSSGRETAARVAAGAVARKILGELGVEINAYIKSIGDIEINSNDYSTAEPFLDECIKNGDSAGGVVECVVRGMPIGIGEPVFDKLDAAIAKAVFSIGAVKGVEFGCGFKTAKLTGSENNDEFYFENDKAMKKTNNSGGVLGGISDGSDIVFRAAIKPTPSISKKQTTVNKDGETVEISITGRHDPVIVPRAVVVVEAMTAITVLDFLLVGMASKIENVKKFF